MNTTKKGDILEDKIYDLFSEQILEDRFIAKSDCCRIHKKKGYYSNDRKKEIIFDVSIEISFPGHKKYSILILIECKNYNHSVPVDDVEEFFSKIQQISGCNTKGIIASTNSFQEGTFNFSESKGIGLLRYYDRDKLDWVLNRSPSSMVSSYSAQTERSNAYQGLHSQGHKSTHYDCYGFVNEIYTNTLHRFFSSLIKVDLDNNLAESLAKIEISFQYNQRLVPYKENHEIESLCQETLQEIEYKSGKIPLDKICDSLSSSKELQVRRNSSLSDGTLGVISFNPLYIEIDDNQAETEQRVRFTLAHELGHLLLGHQKYMNKEACHDSDIDLDSITTIGIKDIVRMEWQANYFASSLLLPIDQFSRAFHLEAIKSNLIDRGYGLLYLDDQQCNLDTFYRITESLMDEFCVSRSVVKIRLNKLGFLNESPKHSNTAINFTANFLSNLEPKNN